MMTRTLIDELLSVMKLKTSLPDSTFILTVQLLLQVKDIKLCNVHGIVNILCL